MQNKIYNIPNPLNVTSIFFKKSRTFLQLLKDCPPKFKAHSGQSFGLIYTFWPKYYGKFEQIPGLLEIWTNSLTYTNGRMDTNGRTA